MTSGIATGIACAAIACLIGCRAPGTASEHGAPRPPAEAERPGSGGARYGPEPEVGASPLESGILDELRSGARGRSTLRRSGALTLAARELARDAAAGAADPLAPARLRTALARGLAFDPAPRAFRVEAPAGAEPHALAASITPGAADSHAGVAAVIAGGRVHVVVLLADRRAELEPFPREARRGGAADLRGRLTTLERPSVHVTAPSGESRTVPVRIEAGRFTAPIRFDQPGRWTVEVIGEGRHGPQVAALLTVSCDGASLAGPAAADPPDPDDPRQLASRLLAAINRTRSGQGLGPLQPDPALSEVARQHSEAMLRAGLLAHRLDGSDGAADRLRRARVPFSLVLENVARGPTALAAHRLMEESPAHRENLLSPDATRVGVGVARDLRPGGDRTVYLTELFTATPAGGDDDRLTPEGKVREALWRERVRRGGAPLTADSRLDELARAAVREMLRRGEPDPGDLPDRALGAGRRVAAADGFVTVRPADAARSRNLGDARFNRVGVAVTVGDDPRRGAGLLWIAVLYTD